MSAALVAACLFAPATASAASSRVAALQVALRAHGVYAGTVDGLTARARRPACAASSAAPGSSPTASSARAPAGRSAPRAATRSARARCAAATAGGTSPRCSSRSRCTASRAARSTAASAPHRERRPAPAGLRRPDRRRRRRAGHARRALTPPVRAPALRRPIDAPLGDRYGPRGNRFHAGLDFPAPTGTAVTAAASGRAIFSGYDDGWGLTVVLDHGNGLHTRYAHLSAALSTSATAVAAGAHVGRVGATGFATGPHLHFEVTVRGANADPGLALGL